MYMKAVYLRPKLVSPRNGRLSLKKRDDPSFFLMIMSAIPVSITREPVGQRRGRIRVAVNLSDLNRVSRE